LVEPEAARPARLRSFFSFLALALPGLALALLAFFNAFFWLIDNKKETEITS